ncbi:MAG: Smr/MutS family protein [Amaricoccus sp.]
MARRRRSLTDEERDLWHQVARSAAPLHPGTAPPPGPPSPPPPPEPAARPTPPRAPEPRRAPPVPDPHAALERANPHMDRRRFEALRRGRMEPEARLDLHGMTSERAHASLTGFILSAHSNGLRLVLVITGKGRPPEDSWQPQRSGILRHSLPHWLAAPPLTGRVLQVAPAHQRHGGTGAFYVYLRRQR